MFGCLAELVHGGDNVRLGGALDYLSAHYGVTGIDGRLVDLRQSPASVRS
jgi:hypothetical protein